MFKPRHVQHLPISPTYHSFPNSAASVFPFSFSHFPRLFSLSLSSSPWFPYPFFQVFVGKEMNLGSLKFWLLSYLLAVPPSSLHQLCFQIFTFSFCDTCPGHWAFSLLLSQSFFVQVASIRHNLLLHSSYSWILMQSCAKLTNGLCSLSLFLSPLTSYQGWDLFITTKLLVAKRDWKKTFSVLEVAVEDQCWWCNHRAVPKTACLVISKTFVIIFYLWEDDSDISSFCVSDKLELFAAQIC